MRGNRGEVLAESKTDEKGAFSLQNLVAGSYKVYVRSGQGGFYLPSIEIEEGAVLEQRIDFLRQRLL